MHNAYKDKTCIIVGNGPSLKKVPLSFLRKYPTFGTNRIFLYEGFQPTFYVSVNPLVLNQSTEGILGLDCPKFVREGYENRFGAVPLWSMPTPLFAYNPLQWVFEGYTVTFVCLQLAFFMGFTTALLVGVDHRFVFEGEPNEQRTLQEEDVNHFHPQYFTNLEWNNPDLEGSEHAYQLAKEAFELVGRRIINLTANTALEVFEKGKVSEWK